MRGMRHETWLVVVLVAFVLWASATPSPAASAARDFGNGAHAFLMPPQDPAGRRGVAGSRPIHATVAVSRGGAAHPTAVTLLLPPVYGPPALPRTGHGQLPPEIMLDGPPPPSGRGHPPARPRRGARGHGADPSSAGRARAGDPGGVSLQIRDRLERRRRLGSSRWRPPFATLSSRRAVATTTATR